MIVALISAVALSGTPMPPRVQSLATAQVRIISGASLNLHRKATANAIAGAKINAKTALIEFY